MEVSFKAKDHLYESTSTTDKIEWTSVTSLISHFKKPFDSPGIAQKCSKNKKSKWYGLTPTEIQNFWSTESKRSTDLGTWYHNQREADITSFSTIEREGVTLRVIKPIEIDGVKYAPVQKLEEGIYPEHFVYLKSAGICGQGDLVEVVNGRVNIGDYKTNKEIKEKGYTSWDGKTDRLAGPLKHLDDCNLMHYTVQLSLYMYIILKHNPHLKPGNLIMYHIKFEEQEKDKWDNPIYKIDGQGNFVIKEVNPISLPYLKKECADLVHWIKDNRSSLKKKILQ